MTVHKNYTEEKIRKDKLVADFMEVKFNPSLIERTWSEEDGWTYKQVNFSQNWNWLMSVVKKINAIDDSNNDVVLMQAAIREAVGYANLDEAYESCVIFIEWYNENSQS